MEGRPEHVCISLSISRRLRLLPSALTHILTILDFSPKGLRSEAFFFFWLTHIVGTSSSAFSKLLGKKESKLYDFLWVEDIKWQAERRWYPFLKFRVTGFECIHLSMDGGKQQRRCKYLFQNFLC